VITVVSDRAGQFELKGLRPGAYQVVAQFPEQYSDAGEVEVDLVDRATEHVDVRVVLQ
jgi:putative heme iron utilization protein